MSLLLLSLAPVFILLSYIYFRDKYEKEPIGMILKGLALGAVIIFPVGYVESWIEQGGEGLAQIQKAAYNGFLVAGFTEELFKFLVVWLVFFRSRQFNERYDGVVYAVSVSLGFAAVENIMYVYSHGMGTGLMRAFTAVPAHTLMGIVMGFYFGLARFVPRQKTVNLFKALMVPWIIHGLYDFILLSQHPLLLLGFIPLMLGMWWLGLRRIRQHEQASAFNPVSPQFAEKPAEDTDQVPPPFMGINHKTGDDE